MSLRLFIIGLLIWLAWRWLRRANPRGTTTTPSEPALQNMVRCARCGLYVPEHDAVGSAGRYYCSAQHRIEDGQ
jgi:uncharacterized protein